MNHQRMVLLIVGCMVVCCSSSSLAEPIQPKVDVNVITKLRQKRAWLTPFPYNSCYALAVVLALPLELKGRNVFFSYNFETNYYFPYFDNVQGLVPLPFAPIYQEGTILGTLVTNNTPLSEVRSLNDNNVKITDKNNTSSALDRLLNTNSTIAKMSNRTHKKAKAKPINERRRKSRAILEHLMTRARFYKMIESKMNSYGMRGRKCLQKAICDTSANPVNEHNGLIGDIVHIIFTPSTSKNENLPRDLAEAERRGKSNKCEEYAKLCPTSVLDAISTYI